MSVWESSAQNVTFKHHLLSIHDEKFNTAEFLLNPDTFPKAKAGDLFEIYHPDKKSKRVLVQVPSTHPLKGNYQVSISKNIASAFDLSARKHVIVEPIDLETVKVQIAEIELRDISVERNEMYKLVTSLYNTVVYKKKKLSFSAVIHRINCSEQKMKLKLEILTLPYSSKK